MVAIGRYSDGTLARMVFGSILNDVFRQSVGTCPVLIKSLNWATKVSMNESGTCFKTSATRPRSSADFCNFIRLIALYTSPFSHALSANCVGSKSPPGSPTKSSSSMSANSFACGCCRTVRCDAACMPGTLYAKTVNLLDSHCERQRCRTQMVGVYSIGWRSREVNFGYRLSFRGRLKGVLCQQTDSLWQEGSFSSSVSFLWPGHYACCPFCFWPSNNPDGRLVQIGRCFPQNAAYDRRAATFCGMECTMAWYSASLEWEGSSTRTATWIETLVRTMPPTALEISDSCCQFASEQVGQTSVGLESEWFTKTGVPTAWLD